MDGVYSDTFLRVITLFQHCQTGGGAANNINSPLEQFAILPLIPMNMAFIDFLFLTLGPVELVPIQNRSLSSSGKDTGFSRRRHGFDSRKG